MALQSLISTNAANAGVAAWATLWVIVAAYIAFRARNRDRLTAAFWMIAIAAFLAVQEDPGLTAYMASISRSFDHDGVLGIVHAHTRGHMYGAAVMAAGGLVMCLWIAWMALRRGERWAWNALLVFLLMGAAVDLFEVALVYPHGFPLAPTPADGVRGFGWTQIAAWIGIWAAALWYSRPQLRSGSV